MGGHQVASKSDVTVAGPAQADHTVARAWAAARAMPRNSNGATAWAACQAVACEATGPDNLVLHTQHRHVGKAVRAIGHGDGQMALSTTPGSWVCPRSRSCFSPVTAQRSTPTGLPP
jgi:hypothetical protein